MPFGAGKHWLGHGGVLGGLLGGWALSGVGMYQSGFPIGVIQANNNSNLLGTGQRPNIVPGVAALMPGSPEDNFDASCSCIRYLNPAAWSAAAPFSFGDSPRTDPSIRTAIRNNWDLALQKTQTIGWRRVTIRTELINAFDNPAFFWPPRGVRPGNVRPDYRGQRISADAAAAGTSRVVAVMDDARSKSA